MRPRGREDMCASCGKHLTGHECTGESGIYSPNETFTLCEPCFLAEDAAIDARGDNDWPEEVARYRRVLAAPSTLPSA